jgi:hypothetical protein
MVTISPSARISSTVRTMAEKLPCLRPVPCVPVAMAPAMACRPMSPWLAKARP